MKRVVRWFKDAISMEPDVRDPLTGERIGKPTSISFQPLVDRLKAREERLDRIEKELEELRERTEGP